MYPLEKRTKSTGKEAEKWNFREEMTKHYFFITDKEEEMSIDLAKLRANRSLSTACPLAVEEHAILSRL
jgi:hypothetical protein